MRNCKMRYFAAIGVALIHLLHHSDANPEIPTKRKSSDRKSNPNGINSELITRERRYVTFPEGSSLAVVFCLTTATPIMGDIFTHGINLGLSYDLPNETSYLSSEAQSHYEPEYIIIPQRRRDRRDIYRRLEVALDSMGLPGRACMLRTLCEASGRLTSKGGMLEEFLRVILTIPQVESRKESLEGEFYGDEWNYTFDTGQSFSPQVQYDKAFLLGRRGTDVDCELYFPDCEISVLDMILPG